MWLEGFAVVMAAEVVGWWGVEVLVEWVVRVEEVVWV